MSLRIWLATREVTRAKRGWRLASREPERGERSGERRAGIPAMPLAGAEGRSRERYGDV
jgi:hypothetical protein